VTQGAERAKFTIVPLPARDNLAANINRWRGQIKLPAEDAKQAVEKTKAIAVDNHQGKLVDLHNPTTNQRILAVVVTLGKQDWYFKMMGDETVVEKERKAFEALMKTVKFTKKDLEKTGVPER